MNDDTEYTEDNCPFCEFRVEDDGTDYEGDDEFVECPTCGDRFYTGD